MLLMLFFDFNPIKFQNRRQKYNIFLNHASLFAFFCIKKSPEGLILSIQKDF